MEGNIVLCVVVVAGLLQYSTVFGAIVCEGPGLVVGDNPVPQCGEGLLCKSFYAYA